MSDEPNKRSRDWLWEIVGVLLLAYPLSMGPALKYGKFYWVPSVYQPLDRFYESWQPVWDLKERYNRLWGVHITRHPITGLHEVRQWEP
jgi:hypothetical protein